MATIQFSDTSNLTGIVQGVDFECDTDRDSYPLKDIARNSNYALDYLTLALAPAGGRLRPVEPTTEQFSVTSGSTTEVALTDDFVKIIDVVVEDSNGEKVKINLTDREDYWEAWEKMVADNSGTPTEYDQEGNKLKFNMTFDYTLANAVTVTYEPLPTYFVSTDTTATAHFKRTLSEAIVLYTSIKWCDIYLKERVANLESRLQQIIKLYSDAIIESNRQARGKMTGRVENFE